VKVSAAYPVAVLPDIDRHRDKRTRSAHRMVILGYHFLSLRYNALVVPAYVIFAEAAITCVWGLPEFLEGLYGTFFLFCITVFFSGQFLVTNSKFLVLCFARTWGTSKKAYDKIRRAASGVRVLVSGAYDKVLKAVRQGWLWLFNGYERVSSAGSDAQLYEMRPA